MLRYCLYKHPCAIALSTGSDRSVKGNSYCCSMYSLMTNPGNRKCTTYQWLYFTWDFVRFCETGNTPGVPLDFEVALLWVVVSFWHSKVFWAIKLKDITGKLGDFLSWVHKQCITTDQVLCLSPDFNIEWAMLFIKGMGLVTMAIHPGQRRSSGLFKRP